MFGLTPRGKKAALVPKAEYPFRWMPEEFSTLFNRFFNRLPLMFEEPEWEPRWEMAVEEKTMSSWSRQRCLALNRKR